MFKILFSLVLFLSLSVKASVELKVGDIILQPLSCWACSLIEAEEETIFSHIGIVVKADEEILVAEAYGKVKAHPLEDFLKKTEKNQKNLILRFRNEKISKYLNDNKDVFLSIFYRDFNGLAYDKAFRWNNFSSDGNEKLYCSELVAKLLMSFLPIETPIKRMHFNQNREHWIKYFQGDVPDNQWGNSPADFHHSELFYEVGEL
jgi:hypothetical protein